jgi:hypothetical protein
MANVIVFILLVWQAARLFWPMQTMHVASQTKACKCDMLQGSCSHWRKRPHTVEEATLKLLYCVHCGDVVRLFPEKRYCQCGKSWGNYLEDNSTTVQTYPSLSLGLANPDLQQALNAFVKNPNRFSPELSIRAWINALSEPDVTFAPGEAAADEDEAKESEKGQAGESIDIKDTSATY